MEATTTLAVQEGFITHLNLFFDGYSATHPDFVGITHAIKDRQGGVLPDYPYIVVEKTQVTNDGGAWLREILIEPTTTNPLLLEGILLEDGTHLLLEDGGLYLTEEYIEGGEGTFSYISEQRVSIMVNCYGDNSDDILNVLRSAIVDDFTRINLNELTGAKFQYYNEINDSPKFLETDFIQGSSIECFFTMITKYTPLVSGFIGNVEIEGEVKEHKDSLESLPVSFNVTN